MFRISLLGPLEVRRDGVLLSVPRGKTAELLVRLALDAGRLVRTDRLLDDLWAEDSLNTRRNTLQAKVAKLRRALGDPPVVLTGDGGYLLDVELSDVDALAALNAVATATHLLNASDDAGVAEVCARTLEMYRGDVLQAADGDWVSPHRARLDEAHAALVEMRFAARLRLGDVSDVIGELESALTSHPFQEGLWELLITALYRAGRQVDALAAYQRVRNQLADELGLEPGPRLRKLELQVLNHDELLDGPHAQGITEHPEPQGNLPSMTAELVGREQEVSALSDLVTERRLVEITGPGGIGKTAIAIETGRRLTSSQAVGLSGIWLVRLEGATSATEVLDALIAALGVAGGEPALIERLKSSQTVLVLDNCEHVVGAVSALVVRLLDEAPRLRILCTSQLPLGVDGEVLFELVPLALSDAVELFILRARAHRPNAAGYVEGAVQELCRSLDGLPLAIELAAARTKTLSIGEITRRLDDRFNLLSDPTSRRPARRRALKSTIAWSYELLFPDDKRGLWALATFSDGAPLPAVEFVLEALDVPGSAAIDVVSRLASRSLVNTEDEGSATLVRYRLLDSIRAFALEALTEAGMTQRAFAAHAAWFASAAGSSTEGVRSSRQAAHLAFVQAERANIDAAITWGITSDPPLAFSIAHGFGWAWIVLGDSRGAQRIHAALEAAGPEVNARDRASALLLATWIEASTGRLDLARKHVAAAAELAEGIDDIDLRARCCYYLAYVVSHDGKWLEAMELTDRSRALYDTLDRPWDQAANALFAARAAISAGDQARSMQARDEVQYWLRNIDDPWLDVRREAMLGELARIQLRFGDAVRHIGRAVETSWQLGFRQTEAYQLSSLGRAECQADDYESGCVTLTVAIEKAEATGDMRLAALGRVHLGRVLRAMGQVDRARTALEAAAAWHRTAGGGEQAALGECLLAALDAAEQRSGAEERLLTILEDARTRDDAPTEVFALDALACIAADADEIATAQDRCREADRRAEAAAHFITDRDRIDAHSVRERA